MKKIKGVYCLVLKISKPITVNVGALGKITFEKGTYCYVGSAMNGLKQRIGRHLKLKTGHGKKFWHIDYLITNPFVRIEKIYFKRTSKKFEECKTAQKIGTYSVSVPNFGSSDCKCNSHLFKIKKLTLNWEEFKNGTNAN